MKTREQIYKGEGAALLRILTTYHALHYEQVLQLFDKNRNSIKSLITSLTKQGRIYHDKEQHLLCDTEESANSPDMGTIAAFWVLLDFKKALIYQTSGDFPVKLHFFSHDETYEIIYVANGQEALMNHVFESIPPKNFVKKECDHHEKNKYQTDKQHRKKGNYHDWNLIPSASNRGTCMDIYADTYFHDDCCGTYSGNIRKQHCFRNP